MIPDEAVRGHTPPPWFRALPGIERIRLWSEGALPLPPLSRLLGIRATHVVPGAVTLVIPASEALTSGPTAIETAPVLSAALEVVCESVMEPGKVAVPLVLHATGFRPGRAQPGNMLARCRILNSGRLYVFAEAQLEDPQGRHLAHATMQAAIRKLDPAPPVPPNPVPSVEEPTYATPDPYLRRYPHSPIRLREVKMPDDLAGALEQRPVSSLFGLRYEPSEKAQGTAYTAASEWFCAFDRSISSTAIVALGNMATWHAVVGVAQRNMEVVPLNQTIRFSRSVPADGRALRAEAHLVEYSPRMFHTDTVVRDADGNVVAKRTGEVALIQDSQRAPRPLKEAKRVLATLLFTDIADSTRHIERLGDAGWRALLEEHRKRVRQEISRYNGTEVDTAGDGFFVRFDSPARAIDAARAVRAAAAGQKIEIRAGIHTGECELEGNRLSGMAVHVASRTQGAAAPGEILVSSTVKDLALGAGFRFEDRGEHTLKGVPDPWRLFCVVD
jgi:class 3 adenylate cyclase